MAHYSRRHYGLFLLARGVFHAFSVPSRRGRLSPPTRHTRKRFRVLRIGRRECGLHCLRRQSSRVESLSGMYRRMGEPHIARSVQSRVPDYAAISAGRPFRPTPRGLKRLPLLGLRNSTSGGAPCSLCSAATFIATRLGIASTIPAIP